MSRKLKTITLAAALTASLAGLAAAAGPEGRRGRMGGPERIQARVERMRQDLDLTEDQARRIEDILMDAAQNRSQGFGREDEGDRGHLREQRRETF
ncbi:MAG TPA: hypothetical protein VFO85_22190, partial [Vicinamibacteria bacterium]|nr:hypothetical protein [Vicinamibacteria bacterium]